MSLKILGIFTLYILIFNPKIYIITVYISIQKKINTVVYFLLYGVYIF